MFCCCYGCFILIAIIITIRKPESTFPPSQRIADWYKLLKVRKILQMRQVSAEHCSRKCHCIEIHTIGLFCSLTSQNKATQTTTRAQDGLKCWFLYWLLKHQWCSSGTKGLHTLFHSLSSWNCDKAGIRDPTCPCFCFILMTW